MMKKERLDYDVLQIASELGMSRIYGSEYSDEEIKKFYEERIEIAKKLVEERNKLNQKGNDNDENN